MIGAFSLPMTNELNAEENLKQEHRLYTALVR